MFSVQQTIRDNLQTAVGGAIGGVAQNALDASSNAGAATAPVSRNQWYLTGGLILGGILADSLGGGRYKGVSDGLVGAGSFLAARQLAQDVRRKQSGTGTGAVRVLPGGGRPAPVALAAVAGGRRGGLRA